MTQKDKKLDFLLSEDNFEAQMKEVVEPYLAGCCKEGYLLTTGGMQHVEIYCAAPPKGTIVISYGFTESCIKYHEFIYYMLKSGFKCVVMDHRGHGHTCREGRDPNVVHVQRFDDYVNDLKRLIIYLGSETGPLYLYGHSMGGCIAARYLEEYPGEFDKAVLNAPMMGLKLGGCPFWAASLLCDINIILGRGDRRLFYQHDFDPKEPFEGSSAGSRARFDYYQAIRCQNPYYQTSSASYRWAREAIRAGRKACRRSKAAKIKIPVLLFQAQEDTLVRPDAQKKFLDRINDGKLVRVPDARHEIYRSSNDVLEPYLIQVIEFFSGKLQ